MGTFIVYILKSSACLALFYLFYKLLLSQDTFHRFNRIALLSLILLSVIIPFCEVTLGEATAIQRPIIDLENLLLTLSVSAEAVPTGQPVWFSALIVVYFLGGITIIGFFVYSLRSLYRIMRHGTHSSLNGLRLIVTDQHVPPFSWMRTIVICRKDYEESGPEILTHEIAHIKAYHSLDLLISEICILFHWFNPAAWLLRQELRNIHEYEADETVLIQGVDAKRYQLLLIKKAVGSQRFTSMANSFNHSSLKKRIAMMLKQKSNPWARLKYLYVLPLAAVTIAAFARPEISKELEKISSAKFSDIIPIMEIIPKDTTRVTAVHKPIVETLIDTAQVVLMNAEAIAKLEKVSAYIEENQEEIQKQIEIAMAAARIDETVAAELAKHQPEIDRVMKEAMGNSKISEQVMAELAKHQPEIDKAIQEAMAAARIDETVAAELAKHQPEIDKAMRQAMAVTQKVEADSKGMAVQGAKDSFQGIVYIDGIESTTTAMDKLDPDLIESMYVHKAEQAILKYGEKGRKGVIEIKTKR